MPGHLNNPKTTVTLDKVKMCGWKIEENPAIGQAWIEMWFVLGRYTSAGDPATFVPYIDPEDGSEAFYIKVEDGVHPLAPNMALGQCDHPPCREWYKGVTSGPCTVCGIGDIQPYDGYTRLTTEKGPSNVSDISAARRTCYEFCADEELPDPDDFTGPVVTLLDATIEYES